MIVKDSQPHLRVVDPDGTERLPRRYAQSTSGLTSSTRMTPPLSRSSRIAKDSPIRCPTQTALRRYPTVVPQRLAKSACRSGVRVLRYERIVDMQRTLPTGNSLSIPAGHLPCGYDGYADGMETQRIRRERLRQLVNEYGTQTALADVLGIEQNYISRCLSGAKRIGEDFAARVEEATGKPAGWMSRLDRPSNAWPFDFDRALWDSLPPERQAELERAFEHMLIGAQAVGQQHRKKRA